MVLEEIECRKERARNRAKLWYYENRATVLLIRKKEREQNPGLIAARKREYQIKHAARLSKKAREYYFKNKSEILPKIRARYEANKIEICARARERLRLIPEVHKARKRRYHEQDKAKPDYVIKRWLRVSVTRMAQKANGATDRAERFLGCSIDAARAHIEKQFKPGMGWWNHGAWHIDHVRPLKSFDLMDPEQAAMASRWDNLQPLWAKENLEKSAKAS